MSYRLCFFDLFRQVRFIAQLLDLVELRFEPIHMAFFIVEHFLEELVRRVVAFCLADGDELVVRGDRIEFQLKLVLQLMLDIQPDFKLHRLGGGSASRPGREFAQ